MLYTKGLRAILLNQILEGGGMEAQKCIKESDKRGLIEELPRDSSGKILDKSSVQLQSRRRIFDGFFKIDEVIVDHQRFDGEMIYDIRREVIVKCDTVSILLYDPKLDHLLFVRQLRVPLIEREERHSPWTIEIVAGTIDRAESPEMIIRAEAEEEAGVEIEKLIPIYQYYPSTGGSPGKMHLYLGLCDLSCAGGYYGIEEEGEDIEAFTMTREEAFQLLDQGKLDNEFTLIAILWFKLHYQEYLMSA